MVAYKPTSVVGSNAFSGRPTKQRLSEFRLGERPDLPAITSHAFRKNEAEHKIKVIGKIMNSELITAEHVLSKPCSNLDY